MSKWRLLRVQQCRYFATKMLASRWVLIISVWWVDMAEVKIVLLGSIGVVAETSELQRQAYNMAFARQGWMVLDGWKLLRNAAQPGGLTPAVLC